MVDICSRNLRKIFFLDSMVCVMRRAKELEVDAGDDAVKWAKIAVEI